MRIDSAYFKSRTGEWPVYDDIDRANCSRAGEVGHFSCGWCWECDLPVAQCGHIKIKDRRRYQLYRFGQPYASWGETEQEVIDRQVKGSGKSWAWLRFLGWSVKAVGPA